MCGNVVLPALRFLARIGWLFDYSSMNKLSFKNKHQIFNDMLVSLRSFADRSHLVYNSGMYKFRDPGFKLLVAGDQLFKIIRGRVVQCLYCGCTTSLDASMNFSISITICVGQYVAAVSERIMHLLSKESRYSKTKVSVNIISGRLT